jgi:3D (Asp-Asp-Asp) domain-containing protein
MGWHFTQNQHIQSLEEKVKEKESVLTQKNQLISEQNKTIKNIEKIDLQNKAKLKELNDSLIEYKAQLSRIQKQAHSVSEKANTQNYLVTMYTNGYESTQKQKGDVGYGITASGKPTKDHHTIACSKELPFGTKIKVEGMGIYTCEDRGSKVNPHHIDFYTSKLQTAIDFGKKQLQVTILGE